jgi:hypothetical protein
LPTDKYRFTLQKDMTYAVEITVPNTAHNIVRGFQTLRDAEAWLSHQRNMAEIAGRASASHEGDAMIVTRPSRRYR